MNKCRACEYTNKIHKDAVETELKRLSQMKGLKPCDEKELERRLNICSSCPQLDMNNVCMMCGCYVQIRAFLKTSRCPIKNW